MEINKKLRTDWVPIEGTNLRFFCAPLTAPQYLNCHQSMPGDAAMLAVRYAVRDWEGVTLNGKPAKFSPRNLEALFAEASPERIQLLGDLGGKILERSTLTEDETKNSSPPSDAQSSRTGRPAAAATA